MFAICTSTKDIITLKTNSMNKDDQFKKFVYTLIFTLFGLLIYLAYQISEIKLILNQNK